MRAEVTVELRRVFCAAASLVIQQVLPSSKLCPARFLAESSAARAKGGWGGSGGGSGGGWGYGGYSAYDAAAMGRGKGYGYKGQEAAQWAPAWSGGTEDESTAKRRLLGRELLAKKLLRPYASAAETVVYGEDHTDIEALGKQSMRTWLTADTSELSRRPAYGFSMMALSVKVLGKQLGNEEARKSEAKLAALLGTSAGKQFLGHMAELEFEKAKTNPRACHAAFVNVLSFFKRHKKELYEHLAVVAAHGASLYLGGLRALDGLVKADALNAWAAQVPPDEYNQKALDAFRSRGSEIASAATFLVDMYNAHKKSESAWKRVGEVRGDDSDNEAPAPAAAKPSSSTSTSSEKKKKKSRKHKKDKEGRDSEKKSKSDKKDKKAKKDKKKRKRSSSSSSSSTTSAPPPPPPAGAPTLTVRRATGATTDGRVTVKESDICDVIDLEAGATVEQALMKLFEAQSSVEEYANWTARALYQDGTSKEIAAATTLAADVAQVVLLRKGG